MILQLIFLNDPSMRSQIYNPSTMAPLILLIIFLYFVMAATDYTAM